MLLTVLANALDQVFLQPLMQLCGLAFSSINHWTENPGYALIVLGVFVNLLLLPLYIQMENSGRAQRELQKKVIDEVRRIKKHFSGREAYYYVQTTYRVYNYSPFKVVLQSFDLLVQVVVFSTIYRYLAQSELIQGVSFGPIADLAEPDALLGGIHLLPFVMTGVNLLSVFAYDPSKRKQGLGLALLFLGLLYASPSGLVIYWTSSNLFSWLRNLALRWLAPRLPRRFVDWTKQWVRQA